MICRVFMPAAFVAIFTASCARLESVGQLPEFTPSYNSQESLAMMAAGTNAPTGSLAEVDRASLWSGGAGSLFGDRRAARVGDILTVVIEINESAEISNASSRSRTGSETMAAPVLFGAETVIDQNLPRGLALGSGASASGSSNSQGDGSVKRNEKLTLRIAATVVATLPNGVIRIEGSQEVRVNFEIRELLVSGFVRPSDISRKNEITYDKIASARVSYGGRGQISDMQQPRLGQQVADILLPF